MALSIKNDEADALAREIAKVTHESLTTAVVVALRERLERVSGDRVDIARRLDRLALEYQGYAVHDKRTPDEIIGYDEHGLPG